MLTSKSESKAMFANASIHQIVVDTIKETIFVPNQLSAFIDDIVMFISMNPRSHVYTITSDRSCQADDSLNVINFSKLMFSYLMTIEHST